MPEYLQSSMFEHQFWLEILMNHGQFIRDSLYPSEKEDIEQAKTFIQRYSNLHMQVGSLNELNASSFAETADEAAEQLNRRRFP
ncbi:DUF2935 domain-containing protein [Rummeliibacillus pycnus]|uniref:DUF2935 domain-containing protein n=1 Tax=Rummeliibacillus pycnus TaxID=101070 RepID=UPI003D2E952E